jgi:hypothetical protein
VERRAANPSVTAGFSGRAPTRNMARVPSIIRAIAAIIKVIAGVAITLLVTVYFFLFPPLPVVPELGRGLSPTFSRANDEFAQRIARAFPAGTQEEVVIKKLKDQGFKVSSAGRSAQFTKSRFPCELHWSIRWEVSEDRTIRRIEAKYGGACL